MALPENQLASQASQIPICVDLDKTLIRTDSLYELAFRALRTKPWVLFAMPFWLARGRAELKHKLTHLVTLDPVHLPYNKEVFFYLKRMAKRQRRIILVTGADQKIADEVGKYLGIFYGIYGSTPERNLVGQNKADLLVQLFGDKGFEYIGDSEVDLAVWAHAHSAIVVADGKALEEKVAKLTHIEKVIPAGVSIKKSVIKAIRPHQWVKNILIFVPMMLAHQHKNLAMLFDTTLGFLSLCFMASAIYVVNDLSDIESDRQHHDKKNRPFASGALPLSAAAIMVPVLLIASLTLALQLTNEFLTILLAYVVTTTAYTFLLKRIAIADIVVLSSLYTLRLLAGSAICYIYISEWLMAFSGFLFLSLAMLKRYSELHMLRQVGRVKTAGRGYEIADLPVLLGLGGSSGYGAVFVLALYVNSEVARSQYRNASMLWMLCPLLIYGISRMWLLANRGLVHSDPVKFAITDQISLSLFFSSFVIWIFASGYIPWI